MHGHVVVISQKELAMLDDARLHYPKSDMRRITIQLAFVNVDKDEQSMMLKFISNWDNI